MTNMKEIGGFMLDAGPNWAKYTDEERALICNGVGPEAWPQKYRDLFDKLPFLKPASMVHDVDFEVGGGWWAWIKANWRFRKNCYRVAKEKLRCSTWSPRWRIVRGYVEAAHLALVLGSRLHWKSEPTIKIEE